VNALEARRALVAETAVDVAKRWLEAWREDLNREGRPFEGGWPGTLPEARARVAASLGRALARRRMATLTAEELRWAARATYEEARRAWLAAPDRRRVALEP
jgi:hypothetical protein